MKNNRSLIVSAALTQQHQLSDASPASDSLFWKMWHAAEPIAQQALATPFVQGIKNGTLNPVKYGAFNVGDAYYCWHGADDYTTAVNRATHPVLKAFLQAKHDSYASYNETFPDTWCIKDASSVVPNAATVAYADFETAVATNEDPIYTLISMLPCEYLWPWLSAQMGTPIAGNVYAGWITGNGTGSGAFKMGNFIEQYCQKYPLDEAKAIDIYTQAMTHECENFAAAL